MTLQLNPLFGDGAVLQRNKPVRVWGRADVGARVTVSIDDMESMAVADANGDWQAVLPAHPAGGPYTLAVRLGSGEAMETTESHDVLYGDVWVLGGQSNMQLWMGRLEERYPNELVDGADPDVRCFIVPEAENFHGPSNALPEGGSWLKEGTDDCSMVSGAGHFFAKFLRRRVDVPIGLLQTAIGGTTIETWISEPWMDHLGLKPADHGKWRNDAYIKAIADEYSAAFSRYVADVDALDCGLAEHWQDPAFDDADWGTIELGDAYAPHAAFSGPAVVWLRKTIDVPANLVGRRAIMRFGTLTDADDCYVNGEMIGQTGYQYPPREYVVPALAERMTIAFRLRIDTTNGGGFRAGKRHAIVCGDDVIDVDALGPWRYAVAARTPHAPEQTFLSRFTASCYNAMIAPIARYGVTGTLWYQGESNATRTPVRYADKMIALVQCWRETFDEPDMPFIWAQLPGIGFEARGWARLRDEQRKALSLKNTAMTVLLDAGEDNDLHPSGKATVGERFAVAAESLVYGADHEAMGPVIATAEASEGSIVLRFSHCAAGLETDGTPLEFDVIDAGYGFAAARVDRLPGRISSPDTVTISLPCDRVLGAESRIRYAWGDSPHPTLRNAEGLLASPFEIEIS